MVRALRVPGWILVALAVGILGWDAVQAVTGGAFSPTATGTLWHMIHSESLQVAEPAVARYLSPYLWNPVITTLLLAPASLVVGVPGLVLILIARCQPAKNRIFGR